MPKFKLNNTHREIIEHRETANIVECHTSDNLERVFSFLGLPLSEQVEMDEDEVAAIQARWGRVEGVDFEALSTLERLVIKNIIELSTAACCYVESFSRGVVVAAGYEGDYRETCKAGRELAAAYNAAFPTDPIEFPEV